MVKKLSYDETKFLVYIMINQHRDNMVNSISTEELDIWYLQDRNKYEGQIFNTHLAINFTSVEKELYHLVYVFLIKWFFSKGIDLVLIGADLVYMIASAISKIEDTDYCVYSRIIELCIGNKERIFSKKDIITANKEGKCDYQDDCTCTYLGKQDDCTCNEEKVHLAFLSLERQNIIKSVGERWMLVR